MNELRYQKTIDVVLKDEGEDQPTYGTFGLSEQAADRLIDAFIKESNAAESLGQESLCKTTVFLNHLPKWSSEELLYMAFCGFIAQSSARSTALKAVQAFALRNMMVDTLAK